MKTVNWPLNLSLHISTRIKVHFNENSTKTVSIILGSSFCAGLGPSVSFADMSGFN